METAVLRLGHRKERDVRVTTHCCLVGRAFLASEVILSGEKDESILQTVKKVVENWGGRFKINYEQNWRAYLKNQKRKGAVLVHLTMYGSLLSSKLSQLRKIGKRKKIIIIIGAGKVPSEVYGLADFNISVTNQPHSEVAALAVFLNELQCHSPLEASARSHFKKAKIRITPGEKGRRILAKNWRGNSRKIR